MGIRVGDRLTLPMCEAVDSEFRLCFEPKPCVVEWIHPLGRFCRVAFSVCKGTIRQSYPMRDGEISVLSGCRKKS